MNKNQLISKLDQAMPGTVLESRRFGRTGLVSIWVEAQAIQKIAAFLRDEPEFQLDWLENLSAVEFEKVFVISYFVRSFKTQHQIVMRASAVPASPHAEVPFPSIRSVWPMGEPMEQEAEELLGICFSVDSKSQPLGKSNLLPEGWKGYPLRKNYVFPKEYMGLPHSRPPVQSGQKKPSL